MSVQITKVSVNYELVKNVFVKGTDGEKPKFIKVAATITSDGRISIMPHNGQAAFTFKKSDPLQALAVAELIAEAAGIAARVEGEKAIGEGDDQQN